MFKQKSQGFTLIEVMVVVVILSILAVFVVPKIMDKPEQARKTQVMQNLRIIEQSLNMYKLDNSNYPSTDQGLDALVTKPSGSPEPRSWNTEGYINRLPKDPWGGDYQYLNPGTHGKIDIFSFGPDGTASDDDIGNWNL